MVLVGAGLLGGIIGQGTGGAFLGTVAGGIAAWAVHRRVLVDALRGAGIGALFLALVGPVGDQLVFGAQPSEKLGRALVIGGMLGGVLGIRNARRRSRPPHLPPPAAGAPPELACDRADIQARLHNTEQQGTARG